MMNTCDACHDHPALYHITLQVSIYGPKTERQKRLQFWLCETCELASRQILCRDELQRERLAYRFVDNPTFLSPTAGWTRRTTSA